MLVFDSLVVTPIGLNPIEYELLTTILIILGGTKSDLMAENKPRLSVTVDQDLIDWIDEQIKEKHFANRSHAVEACLYWYKNRGGQSP